MTSDAPDIQNRATLMYWQAMSDLKLRSVTMRLDRDRLARVIRRVETIKAIASSGGVAGWVIWKNFPLAWSGVILVAQLLDALKHVLPFTRQHESAAKLATLLDFLFIDMQYEWENIIDGELKAAEVRKAAYKLRRRVAEITHAHDQYCLEPPLRLILRAVRETDGYMQQISREAESGDQT